MRSQWGSSELLLVVVVDQPPAVDEKTSEMDDQLFQNDKKETNDEIEKKEVRKRTGE